MKNEKMLLTLEFIAAFLPMIITFCVIMVLTANFALAFIMLLPVSMVSFMCTIEIFDGIEKAMKLKEKEAKNK